MNTSPQSKTPVWFPFLIVLFLLGGALRLIDLDDPPLDFHPVRQLRNAIVAREIYYQLLPDADPRLQELASSFAHSVAYYEPPMTETIVAITYLVNGGESFAIPRLWESLFWMFGGLALFDLARRAISPWAGLVALTYYLVLPFAVQASRSFQPDPLMTAAFVAGIYFLYRWSEEQAIKWASLAGIFLGLAVLVKIVIAFFAGAAAVALVLFTLRRDFWRSRHVWAMASLMILPAFIYYVLMHFGRSSEFYSSWSVAQFELIMSRDLYSRWLALLGSLFGLTILFLSMAGSLIAAARLRWLLVSLWVGYVAYGLTFPFYIYTHSYYHIQLIPIIAMGLAVALEPIRKAALFQSVGVRTALVTLAVAVTAYQAWVARSVLMAIDFRNEPPIWAEIGKAIPEDSRVIGLTQDYGLRLMLFGWRKVSLWPLSTDRADLRNGDRDLVARFDELTAGDDYFLVTAFNQLEKQADLKQILDGYPVTAEGQGFVLYDLR